MKATFLRSNLINLLKKKIETKLTQAVLDILLVPTRHILDFHVHCNTRALYHLLALWEFLVQSQVFS